jgi:hypothetical protein
MASEERRRSRSTNGGLAHDGETREDEELLFDNRILVDLS